MTDTLTPVSVGEGWIEHDRSSACPVDPDSRPMVKLADGYIFDPFLTPERRKWRAGNAMWQNIVAYRP